jgi:hypothetical protein
MNAVGNKKEGLPDIVPFEPYQIDTEVRRKT